MSFDKKEINEILESLSDGDFSELFEEVFYDKVVYPFKQRYKKTFTYASGATKGVLIFKQFGFVVKIPFNCNCDAETLLGADDSGSGWNYCEVEEIKCEKAEIFGVRECFAETFQIGFVKDYPIYAQEYAEVFSNTGSPSPQKTEEELNKIEDMCEGHVECFNSTWLSDALDFFGEKIFYNLLSFIDDFDISDLHDANIGYIGMRPVLVDYSSFND